MLSATEDLRESIRMIQQRQHPFYIFIIFPYFSNFTRAEKRVPFVAEA